MMRFRHHDNSEESEPSDLGFGTHAGNVRGGRLLNRDGSFAVRRTGLGWRASLSLYHRLLTMTWPVFIALLIVAYLLVNALFALAYLACGPEAIQGPGEHDFARSFFFSVQTISSVGYGHLSPGTMHANLLMTVESIVGLLGVALATGLVFARFSRPRADIVFSKRALVAPYRGGWGLMFRIANRRKNQISGVEARVMLSLVDERDGTNKRHFQELKLERKQITFFPLTWTIVHPIDETSPLSGLNDEDLVRDDAEVFVQLQGTDETFAQPVHARSSYRADEIVWWVRFSDIYERSEMGRPTAVDVARIHDFEPVESS